MEGYDTAMQTCKRSINGSRVYSQGDIELDPGVIRQVKVYIASKRAASGDKMVAATVTKGLFKHRA